MCTLLVQLGGVSIAIAVQPPSGAVTAHQSTAVAGIVVSLPSSVATVTMGCACSSEKASDGRQFDDVMATAPAPAATASSVAAVAEATAEDVLPPSPARDEGDEDEIVMKCEWVTRLDKLRHCAYYWSCCSIGCQGRFASGQTFTKLCSPSLMPRKSFVAVRLHLISIAACEHVTSPCMCRVFTVGSFCQMTSGGSESGPLAAVS